jgi:hypothetical protein
MDNGVIFNNANVRNNGSYPDPIKVPSAINYKPVISLELQRTTSYGLMFGGGVSLGNYRQDFDVVYDSYDFLDTGKVYKETSAKFSYRNHSMYWGIRMFVGYTRQIKLSGAIYHLEGKLGITGRNYLSGGKFQQTYAVSETKNDTMIINKYLLSDINSQWGNLGQSIATRLVMDLNVGLRKEFNKKLLSSLSIGFYATLQPSRPDIELADKADVSVRSPHYLNGQYQYGDMDYYIDREIAFGIRTSIGLKL